MSDLVIVTVVPALVSEILFERQVSRRWRGRKIGPVVLREGTRSELLDALKGLASEASVNCRDLGMLEGLLNSILNSRGGIAFDEADRVRWELADLVARDDPVPEPIAAVAKKAVWEITEVMRRAADKAKMGKELKDAEERYFNLGCIIDAKTPDETMGPLINPISRPRIIRMVENYEHLGGDAQFLLAGAYIYVRSQVAEAFYFQPAGWIGGVTGIALCLYLGGGYSNLLVGWLSGQLLIPALMGWFQPINRLIFRFKAGKPASF